MAVPAKVGSYEIVGVLGSGGMGVVYDARDARIGRKIALKVILWQDHADYEERDFLRDRLFREARTAGTLNHPGIVTIYEVGEDSDRAYIAMERVEGPTLEAMLASGPISDLAMLLSVLEQSAAAIDFAHENGVIHRDIKPANIMLHRGSRVKIADFGIAKVLSTQNHTRTGLVMGTPSYMSPEQIKAQPLDGRSDQFSLAIIAFEMLTGQKPFRGDSLASLVHQIVYEDPSPVRPLNSKIHRSVNVVIRRALSKAAADRYSSCVEFVQALSACLQSINVVVARAPLARKTSRSLRGAVVAFVLLIVGSGLGYVLGRKAESSPRTDSAAKQTEKKQFEHQLVESDPIKKNSVGSKSTAAASVPPKLVLRGAVGENTAEQKPLQPSPLDTQLLAAARASGLRWQFAQFKDTGHQLNVPSEEAEMDDKLRTAADRRAKQQSSARVIGKTLVPAQQAEIDSHLQIAADHERFNAWGAATWEYKLVLDIDPKNKAALDGIAKIKGRFLGADLRSRKH